MNDGLLRNRPKNSQNKKSAQTVAGNIIRANWYFPEEKIVYLKDKLRTMDDDKFSLISTVQMKDPNTVLLVSIFLGVLGIDRFMIGDTGMGILKLLTCGCCGVLTIIDWFTISKKTRELNFNKVMTLL